VAFNAGLGHVPGYEGVGLDQSLGRCQGIGLAGLHGGPPQGRDRGGDYTISQVTSKWPGRSTIRKFFAHAGNVITGEYRIEGGTGAFAGATGSGNFQITTLGHDKFTETFS
jgi:hypothetical protein